MIINVTFIIVFLVMSVFMVYNVNLISNLVERVNIRKTMMRSCIIMFPASIFYSAATIFDLNVSVQFMSLAVYYCAFAVSSMIGKRKRKLRSIYIALLYLLIDSSFQSLILIILQYKINVAHNYCVYWLSSIALAVIVYSIVRKIYKSDIAVLEASINSISKTIYVMIAISLFLMSGLLANLAAKTESIMIQSNITKLLTILCITINIIIIISLIASTILKTYYKQISDILEEQIDSELEHYELIGNLNTELREFKHDYKNHMLCIQALINDKQYDDLSEYVSQITDSRVVADKSFCSGNKIADIILSDKNKKAGEAGCSVSFCGEISDKIPSRDICVILSNSLDNAIEACQNNTSSEICSIKVQATFVRNMQMFEITNPIFEDITVRNNMVSTSKPDKGSHGFGLYNIKKVVDSYNGDFEINTDNGEFCLSLGFQISN